jgi:hypothetical protein
MSLTSLSYHLDQLDVTSRSIPDPRSMVGAFLQLLASQSNDHLLPDHFLFRDILSVLFEIDGDESGNDQH